MGLRQPAVVIVGIALSYSLRSWSQKNDLSQKIDNCKTVVEGLINLHTWWDSLDAIKQAAPMNISEMVSKAEALITTEQKQLSLSILSRMQRSRNPEGNV